MISNTFIYSRKYLDLKHIANTKNMMMASTSSGNLENDSARDKVNKTLIALGVIASLKENDLLTWDASGVPNVQAYGKFRGIRRYCTSQSRHITVYYLNKTVYDAITMFREGDYALCNRLKSTLLNALHGLKNLMTTYSSDIQIVQAIDILNQEIMSLENDYHHEEAIN